MQPLAPARLVTARLLLAGFVLLAQRGELEWAKFVFNYVEWSNWFASVVHVQRSCKRWTTVRT